MSINKVKNIIIIVLVTSLLVAECVWLVLPKIGITDRLVGLISSDFHNKTGAYLQVENLKIKTYPNFLYKISADKIEIKNENFQNLIYSEKLLLESNILRLLLKTVDVKGFKSEKLDVNAIWRKDKVLGLGKNVKVEEYISNLGLKFKLDNMYVNLKNQNITVFDEIAQRNIVYNAPDMDYKVKRHKAKLDTEGTLLAGGNETNIKIHSEYPYPLEKILENPYTTGTTEINNFDISVLNSFIPDKYLQGIISIEGIANINANKNLNSGLSKLDINLKNFAILADSEENSIRMIGDTSLIIPFEKNNDVFSISDGCFKSNDFWIEFAGKVKNLHKPDFDLDITVKNSLLGSMLKLVPANTVVGKHKNLIKTAKEQSLSGIIDGKVNVIGDLKKADIIGKLFVKEAKFKNEPTKADVGLDFKDDKVIIDAKATTISNRKISVKGFSKLSGDEYGEYKISTDDRVEISSGFGILKPLAKMFDLNIAVLKFLTVNGYGNLQLETKGTIDTYTASGIFNFYNSTIEADGIAAQVKNATGSLEFKGKDMLFKTSSALLDGAKLSVVGTSNVDGYMDYSFITDKSNTNYLLEILKNSDWLKPYAKNVKLIESADGKTDMKFHFYGKMKNFEPDKFEKNIKYDGALSLYDNDLKLYGVPFEQPKLNGKIDFKDDNVDVNLKSNINGSIVEYTGKIVNDKININAISNGVYLSQFYGVLSEQTANMISDGKISFNMNYNGKMTDENINYNAIKLNAKILPQTFKESRLITLKNGTVTLNNGSLHLQDINSSVGSGALKINGNINKFADKNQNANITCVLKNFDISVLNHIKDELVLPQNLKTLLDFYKNYKGIVNSDIKIVNNKLQGKAFFSGIEFQTAKNDLPIKLESGAAFIKNNKLNINSLNGFVADSPFFANFSISDIVENPYIKGYLTAKIDGNFADTVINPYMTYPLKVKGDSNFSIELEGNSKKLFLHPKIKILPESDISYMGASIEDTSYLREISSDIFVVDNKYTIKNFKISKNMHESHPSTIFLANAKLEKNGDNVKLQEFGAKTYAPLNAKIFNILFKKSMIKQGDFTCDLKYVLNNNKPLLNGKAAFVDLDLPAYNTNIKSLDLDVNQNNVHIVGKSKIFESELDARILTGNIFRYPMVIEHFDIFANNFNTNVILDTLSQVTFSNTPQLLSSNADDMEQNFSTEAIIIKKGKINAENVQFRTLDAKNLSAQFTLVKDKLLLIRDINVDVANGNIQSNGYYNLKNGELAIIGQARNVDANNITGALFGLKNQIYGTLSGQMSMTTRGHTDEERLQNTFGYFEFAIENGKMPKLGSLEYLLKAGNLVKSGIAGLSINHVVNLFAPFNTGEFEKIQGSMQMESGEAKNIEIFSKGNNLSLYIHGKYDFPHENADMKVWGKLTNDRNNLLGPVGNVSMHTFFRLIPESDVKENESIAEEIKKIPELNTKSRDVRFFNAQINGNLDSDNAVSTFYWID